jgi:hypothetical protein
MSRRGMFEDEGPIQLLLVVGSLFLLVVIMLIRFFTK